MSEKRDWNDLKREGVMPADPSIGAAKISEAPSPKLADSLRAGANLIFGSRPANPLVTGFVDLDAGLRRFGAKEVTMLAADSGVGKSTIATQMALHAAMAGHGVVYLNLEMSEEMYGARTLSSFAGVSVRHAVSGELNPSEYQRIVAGCTTLNCPAKRIVLGNGKDHRTVASIKKFCESAKAELQREGTPLAMIIVDHILQVMVNVRNDKDAEGKARADMLKEIADSLGVHVLALVHITREGSKAGTMPTKNQLASSAWFDRHADNVLVFHQKRTPEGTFDRQAKAKLSCQKSRWGDPFAVELEYQGGFFYPWTLERPS